MGTLRNFIDVEGLSSYDELPKEMDGQVMQISECENIPLPIKNINIRNIYQLLIDVQVTSSKNIKTPINTLVILDGVKKLKVIYYDEENKAGILDVKVPFNTFIELKDKDEEFKNAKVHVLDGFFQLLPKNILYSHLLYHINIFTSSSRKSIPVKNIIVDNNDIPNQDLNASLLKSINIDYNTPSKKVSKSSSKMKHDNLNKKTIEPTLDVSYEFVNPTTINSDLTSLEFNLPYETINNDQQEASFNMSYEMVDTETPKNYPTKNKRQKKGLGRFSKLKILNYEVEKPSDGLYTNYDFQNELSLSKDSTCSEPSPKITPPTVREESPLLDKWCNFVNIDEEYL